MRGDSARVVCFVDTLEERSFIEGLLGPGAVFVSVSSALGAGARRLSRHNRESVFCEIEREHLSSPFGAVVFWEERYVLAATELALRLDLPTTVDDAWAVRDKLLMKERLRSHVPCAVPTRLEPSGELPARELRFPAVLKPRYGYGSICAVRVESRAELAAELAEKRAKLAELDLGSQDVSLPADPELLVEPYVDGSEHDVESFVVDGRAVVQIVYDKAPMRPPYFIEEGEVIPSALATGLQDRLAETTQRAIRALGIRHGWVHAELKLVGDEPWVMELGARMGGAYIPDMMAEAYGIDMRRMLVDYLTSGVTPAPPVLRRHVIGRVLVARGVGYALRVRGRRWLARQPWARIVERHWAARTSGWVFGPPLSYRSQCLYYFVSADSAAEARRRAELAARRVGLQALQLERVPRTLYRTYCRLRQAWRSGSMQV